METLQYLFQRGSAEHAQNTPFTAPGMLTCRLSERNRRPISNGEGLQAAVREAETSIIVATSTMQRADMYTCHQHSLIRMT
jgi:hypothetical protein